MTIIIGNATVSATGGKRTLMRCRLRRFCRPIEDRAGGSHVAFLTNDRVFCRHALGSVSPSGAVTPDLANDYELNVRLDPSTGSLSADGIMTIVADTARAHVDLLLNKALNVEHLSGTVRPTAP